MNGAQSDSSQNKQGGGILLLLLVLGGALALVCHEAFLPNRVMWANDVPLGAMIDPSNKMPGTMSGHWGTLEFVGGSSPSTSPSFTYILQAIFPPQIYLKIYTPLAMFILGLGAWFFFRQLGFARPVCIVGGLGAGLNMHFFSNACWGLGQWPLASGVALAAMGLVVSPSIRPYWAKIAIAGLCIGMVVMEAFDVGAILSIYLGMFIVFYCLVEASDPVKAIPKTVVTGTVVVIFALLISASTLYTLVGTQIKGTVTGGQTPEERSARWGFATQWSFPKLETVRLFTPGVFGYRLRDYITGDEATAYWGRIGEDPRVDELTSSDPKKRAEAAAGFGLPENIQDAMASDNLAARENIVDQIKDHVQRRHTGSGDYTGVLVCLLAVFGIFNAWRKVNPPYTRIERQMVWFFSIAALVSLMAAWGRFGPVFQFIYKLPFFNNIRNPIKYLHPLNIFLIVLSGFGMEVLQRRYMRTAVARNGGLIEHVKRWWGKAAGFDKKWAMGSVLFVGASLVALLIYGTSTGDLAHYLEHNGFSADMAAKMASFSVKEAVYYVVFLAASVAVILGILSGAWTGAKAKWAWILLGVIMFADLARTDLPWVRYYDWTQKYSPNPVVEFLSKDPYEHRVMSRFSPTGGYIPGGGNLGALCHWWLENDYLANNIESLEIDQAPRMPELDRDYINNFELRSMDDLSPPVRLWRLSNTRYILAGAEWTDRLNAKAEPRDSFRDVMRLHLEPKANVPRVEDAGDLTLVPNDNGEIALIEFTKALPRAKLYANWQVMDNTSTLATLNSPDFDPDKTVIVADDTPLAEKPAQPSADPGTVRITDYQPKDVKLEADAKTPSVLLLNDRTGDYWKAWVDGQPAKILRCNFIMRGLYLTPGHHEIEFRFRAPLQWLYVSATGCIVGLLLVGVVAAARKKTPVDRK